MGGAEELTRPVLRMLALEWERLEGGERPPPGGGEWTADERTGGLVRPFLRREIAARPAEFSAAQVVGTVLGKYQLASGDGELTCRWRPWSRGENSSR